MCVTYFRCLSVSPARSWVTWRPQPRFPCLCSLPPRLSRYSVTLWKKRCLFLADHPRDLMIEGHGSIFKYSRGVIIVIHSYSSTSFSKLSPEPTNNYLWNVWVIWGNQVVTLSPQPEFISGTRLVALSCFFVVVVHLVPRSHGFPGKMIPQTKTCPSSGCKLAQAATKDFLT